VIPIGGLEEVGKNSMVVEYENDILVIDMGFQFPEEELFGVDYVVPDVQYLKERKDRIRGILITHGHLDHIGGLAYVLPELGFPTVYATKLTVGLIKKQLKEHKLIKQTTIKVVDVDRVYSFGPMHVEFFRVNHSIPDAVGLCVRTPEGTMVHSGDFKFDFTPADGVASDIGKLSRIGKRGVDMLFSDSTNANEPGHTLSEQVVAEGLESAISNASGRIVIACFSSLIGRIQQIIQFAEAHNRKVFLSGRSIENNVEIAKELGFIKAPPGLIKTVREVKDYPDHKVLILTTGSQGEPMAALTRMVTNSHTHVKIKKGDTVVVSASPIIGNETRVAFLVDNLSRLGADIVHNRIMDVHTSGHGQQEDLKMMMSLVRPKHMIPVHGNHYMRSGHAKLARLMGIPDNNIHLMDNGNVIEMRKGKVSFKLEDIGVRYIMIDGLGRGDLSSHVMKDREAMASSGLVSVLVQMKNGRMLGTPDIESRGFIYKDDEKKTKAALAKVCREAFQKLSSKNPKSRPSNFEEYIRSALSGFIVRNVNKRPIVLVRVVAV